MRCALVQINVNPQGGVPKHRVAKARLNFGGVSGDKQNHRRFHGGPMRAVCLYSLELIQALQAEGHPIEAGSTGENLTISGLNWSELKSGVRLQIGQAQIELTRPTVPCHQITASFSDGQFKRIGQKTNRGWSRWYARVLIEAQVCEGERVEIVDAPPN
jgi:MOSC domain-containing protein YiiM